MTTVEILSLPNFDQANILEEMLLAADAAAAQAIITVINTNGGAVNDFLTLSPAGENGELKQIQSITAQAITLTNNLALQHRDHERVVKLFGDKLRIYRAPNVDGTPPAVGAFSLIGTVDIDPDQPYTLYTDAAGGADFWYVFTYYNSQNSGETDLSLADPTRGGGYGHLVPLSEVRDEAGLAKAKDIDDTKLATRRDEAEDEVKGSLSAAGYTIPLQTVNGVPFVPPQVRGIARLLAAGLVLGKNFGTAKPSSSKDGASKQKAARDQLKAIGDGTVALLDTNGVQLAKPRLVSGYPDDTTKDDGIHVGPRATMQKVF